jgi:hypothetical protein
MLLENYQQMKEETRRWEELERRARFDMNARKQIESEQRFELIACIMIFGWIPIVLGWMLLVFIFG